MLSSTYVYYREVNLDDDVLNISTIVGGNASLGDKVLDQLDGKFTKQTVSSKSEPNLAESRSYVQGGGLWKSRSNNSLNYDGDTDSINDETDGTNYKDMKLKCSICDIEYNAYLEFPPAVGKDAHDGFNIGKKFRKHKRKKQEGSANSDDEESNQHKVNFEDYKDWAHRMEEFDPRAERKWTLEYEVDSELPRLAKIIIGRGHENEFPELNNIHLFDNVKLYRKSSWRNSILTQLKNFNSNMKAKYTVIPTNQTCLFCFAERQQEIRQVCKQGHTFSCSLQELRKDCPRCNETVDKYKQQMNLSVAETTTKAGGDGYRKRNHSAPVEPVERTKSKFDKGKFKNVFMGKSITKIMRSTKNREQTVEVEEEDKEEFEVI